MTHMTLSMACHPSTVQAAGRRRHPRPSTAGAPVPLARLASHPPALLVARCPVVEVLRPQLLQQQLPAAACHAVHLLELLQM
jgi:hypothetical protein